MDLSLAMTLFALPSIGGFFMFLPYVSFVPGFPLPMVISLIGLTGYWAFIFLRKAENIVKWARFAALTFLGMLSTHAFTIGIGAQRTMWTRPGYPFYKDFTWWLFNWVGEANWVAVILVFLSIPLLSVGKRKGWWLAITGAIAILMMNVLGRGLSAPKHSITCMVPCCLGCFVLHNGAVLQKAPAGR